MRCTVIHVVLSPQNLESTGKPSQKLDLVTGNMQWERMGLFHVMTAANPHASHGFLAKNKESGTSVANRLDAARFQLITKNRHYLKTILEVLMVCSQQEIALRGHDESMKSLNKGNFLEILKLISSHDEIIKERFAVDPGMLFIHLLSSRMSYW